MTSPARVLAILNLFDEKHPVWHTDEINAAMGYTRATGYRYVKDLVEAGFLRKVSAGRYSLGPRIIELDYQVRRSDPVLRAAVPVMDDLVKKARLDAVLSMIYGTSLVDIYRASVNPTLQLSYGRGRPRPLFLGAAPKVILSQMARPQLVKIYEACAAEAAASGLGNTWPEFRSRLAAIRKEGFYWSHGELDRWLSGAAMPLFDAEGEVAAALTLVGLKESLAEAGEHRLRSLLGHACGEIQARVSEGVRLPASPAAVRAAFKNANPPRRRRAAA